MPASSTSTQPHFKKTYAALLLYSLHIEAGVGVTLTKAAGHRCGKVVDPLGDVQLDAHAEVVAILDLGHLHPDPPLQSQEYVESLGHLIPDVRKTAGGRGIGGSGGGGQWIRHVRLCGARPPSSRVDSGACSGVQCPRFSRQARTSRRPTNARSRQPFSMAAWCYAELPAW